MADQGKRERGDSTMDVLLDEVDEAPRDPSLDRLLGELEEEVERRRPLSSMPPPLPARDRTTGTNSRATKGRSPKTAPRKTDAQPARTPPTPARPSAPPVPARSPLVSRSSSPACAAEKGSHTGAYATAARPPSIPPPLPPPSRPPSQRTQSAPPPPHRGRVSGLGRPGSIPPPRSGYPTAPGIAAPSEPDSDEQTIDRPKDAATAAMRDAARELAGRWEAELAEANDRARKGRLAYELGRLYEGPLRDLAKAAAHYQSALACMPDHLPTLRGARRVAIARKDHRAALPLFDAEARVTADSRRKAALLYAKGRLLEDALGERDRARAIYATAAELDRQDASILKALEQRDADAPERLERTLEREANAVASDARHRAALIIDRARVLEHQQKRVDAAIELYETALKLDPHARAALDSLERLAAAHGRWRELIRALSLEAEQSSSAETRALALYRIGRIHAERLGNREEAITALERAAQERPDDALVLEELVALYERAERFEALVSVLSRLAERSTDAAEQLAAWHRIGQLHDERLGSAKDARAAYERALALDPTHVPTLQALGRIYEAAADWDALAAMHRAEAEEVADPKRSAAAHARVADVLERNGGRTDEAIAHHARALSLSPGYAPSFKALARLYADGGKHRELIELYERAVEQADEPEPAITHLFKIGAIYEDALGEHAQAAHTYRRILDLDPESLGALHALQRATERAGRHAELVDALVREAALRGEDARAVELVARAAEILDVHLHDRDGAIARYRRVLEIDPRHTPSIGGLGRIFHRAGRWEDLLDLYRRELDLEETKRGAALLHKMGLLCEERIGDEAQAIECYRRAIDVDPTHRPSLTALARKLAARGEHAELVRVLELTLEGLTDPAARARAAFRLAEVHEQLAQPDRAATAYESALASVPGYAPAENALARLRADQGAWRRLVDQLEQQAARAASPAVAVAQLARAGELWARALGDPRRAASCYERALELSPRHLESVLALERLYRTLSRNDALARVYGTLARVLTDPGARVAALRELARLEQRGDGDLDELRQIHEAILGLAPDDAGALETLGALALERGDRALLARVDRRLVAKAGDAKIASAYQTRLAESLESAGDAAALDAYRAALDSDPENIAAARGLARAAARANVPEAVVEAARREAAVAPDPRTAARHLVEAAKVARAKLGDARAAAKDFERALELWPDDADAAAGLSEILTSANQAARAADRLARAAASAKSAERVAALWLEVARLQSDLLDNVPGALTSLGRVLKSSPQHVPTLRRTAELHVRQSRWQEAASLLARVVSLAPDREVLKAAHLELARIWAERSNDLPRALVSLQAVLALEEDHPEALARLAEVAARSGDLDKAAHTLRRLVDRAPSPSERAKALLRAADVHARRGDHEAAKRAVREALAIEGPHGSAYERHRQLATERADWKAHTDALKTWIASASPADREGVRDASLEIGRVCREVLDRPEDAIEVLEQAARAHPELELRRALAQALRHAGRHEEAIAELRSLIGESVVRAELWRELSHTLRAAGDQEGARRALVPLVLLGSAHGEELREVKARNVRVARARPGSLDASLLEALYPLHRAGALIRLWRLVMQGLGKLYPPDFEAFGVSSRDRMSTRSPEPLRVIADRVIGIFGTGEVHLYLHRARARGIAVELTTPPSILLPAAAVELGEAHQAFTLARASSNIALGLHAVDKLTPRELEIVLAAAARHVVPSFGAGLTSEDVLEDIKKRLAKALPRRARKELEELAREYVRSEHDFVIVTEAIVASACRVALLVADDLLAAVEVLKRTERDLAELSGARLLAHPTVSRLARFWISPEADALRARMGHAEPTLAQKTTP